MPKYRSEYNAIDDPSLRDLHEGKDLFDKIYTQIHEIWDACDPIAAGDYTFPVLRSRPSTHCDHVSSRDGSSLTKT